MIKKAVVLAAGFGKRLRPFTCTVPKPLMPVWGETMLDRIVDMLRMRGVEEIVVNAHHLSDKIVEWAKDKPYVKLSVEKEILGNGGALNPIRSWIASDAFYLVSGDIVVENVPDLDEAFEQIRANQEVLGVALATERGPRTIEIEPESGYVTNWRSDDAGYEGTFTYCGFAVLKAEVLDFIPSSGFSSIIDAYETAMMKGHFIKSVLSYDLLWEDAGTLDNYLELNESEEENAFADIPHFSSAGVKKISFLFARGSDRAFFKTEKGIAICYDDAVRGENAKYAGHARYLAAHEIPVPQVVYENAAKKMLILEDVGASKKMSAREGVEVMKTLAKFHSLASDFLGHEPPCSLEPAFDAALWKWEHDLFVEHCLLARFRRELTEDVESELKRVAEMLECEPKALVHRDFQSTNVLWKDGRHTFIDFQGMRLGPAAYDVASFIYDPYVSRTEKEREALLAAYSEASGRSDIEKILPFAAVQRLVQCLGAYGRLASVGQKTFSKYVLPALENLLVVADAAGLDAIGALAEDLIAKENH